eukprot:TRINITY_DN1087_c0_g1_i1.p1 TRINITY_DN1087_c0_g1~~TRINITY_DN1087_c0_g1_i1.p1  ORF type:complete len:318 (+),score=71.82 TRINITY_DN1087_c0_g1_i1:199-1152(+)
MADSTEEVIRLKQQLAKRVKEEDVNGIVASLEALENVPLSKSLLKETGIGLAVGRLRKHQSAFVKTASLRIVGKWKKLAGVPPKRSNTPPPPPPASPQTNTTKPSPSASPRAPSPSPSPSPSSSTTTTTTTTTTYVPDVSLKYPEDALRRNIAEKLGQSISTSIPEAVLDGTTDSDLLTPGQCGVLVEEALFSKLQNTGTEYKQKARSLLSNLRDVKNPDLRFNLRLGALDPDRLVVMKPQELASDDLKKKRDETLAYFKEAVQRGGTKDMAATDIFLCGKCGQRKTSYTQLQTRSADEPMTTYVFCLVCGKRWKFS